MIQATNDQYADAVTFSPLTNAFYVGRLPGENYQGRNEKGLEKIAILNPRKLDQIMQAGRLVKNLNADRDGAVTYVNHEMVRQAERQSQGKTRQGAMDSTSLQNITRVELLTELINKEQKDTFLINGVTIQNVPKLKLDKDIILHVGASTKTVKKRQRTNVDAPETIQVQFDLANFGKLSRIMDTPDEDEISALISPTQTAIDDISQTLQQDENLLIKAGLDKFVDKTKGSWSAFTSDHNTRNPLKDIQTEKKRITLLHGRVNTIVMNSILWADFVGNTAVKGLESMLTQEQPGIFKFSKLPGYDFIIDEEIADGECYVYDRRAIQHGVGPMVSESFRDPKEAVSGHIIRKWVEPVVPTRLATDFAAHMKSL